MTQDEIEAVYQRLYGVDQPKEPEVETSDPYDGIGGVCFLAGFATCLAWVLFIQAVWK